MLYKCNVCKERFEEQSMIKLESTNKSIKFIRYCEPCYEDHLLRQKNKKQLDELYNYVKTEIMGYPKNTPLTNNMVRRLQSIRANKPISVNDDVPYKMNEGTPYKIILIAFKLKRNEIIRIVKTKDFKNELQKFNYICAIVENYIPDAKKYIQQNKKNNEKLEILNKKIDNNEIKIYTTESKYVKQNKDNDNKDDFNDLW